jgi:hypothetical protein
MERRFTSYSTIYDTSVAYQKFCISDVYISELLNFLQLCAYQKLEFSICSCRKFVLVISKFVFAYISFIETLKSEVDVYRYVQLNLWFTNSISHM